MDSRIDTSQFVGKVKFYNGNPNLKASGVRMNFTSEQAIEWVKCANDPKYFIENYCWIINIDKGLVPFKMYDAFDEYINSIHNNRWTILMASRQLGKTTTSAAYILWYVLFNKEVTVAILSNKAPTSREILSRFQLMYEYLPFWLQQGVVVWNKGSIQLENKSKVFTGSTTKSGIRSSSVNLLYIDEMAIIPNNIAEDFFASVYPTVSSGKNTKIVITSTPLGYNHFWRFWDGAKRGMNGFNPVFIPWYKIPGRDREWADDQLRQLGPVRFRAEVECEFMGSSNTLLPLSSLQKLTIADPLTKVNDVDVLVHPEKDHSYIIVVDPSEGTANDYSAFSVIDISQIPYRVVAKYRNNTILPSVLPNIIHKTALYYNSAYVLVEINKAEEVASILAHDLEYENLIYISRKTRTGQVPFGDGKSYLGVKTDKIVKRVGCYQLQGMIENDKLIVQDPDIISEFSTFVEKRGSYAAEQNAHDDLVMTLVLFSWLASTPWFAELSNGSGSIRESLYDRQLKVIEENLIPFHVTNGTEDIQMPVMVTETEVWFAADDPHMPTSLFGN